MQFLEGEGARHGAGHLGQRPLVALGACGSAVGGSSGVVRGLGANTAHFLEPGGGARHLGPHLAHAIAQQGLLLCQAGGFDIVLGQRAAHGLQAQLRGLVGVLGAVDRISGPAKLCGLLLGGRVSGCQLAAQLLGLCLGGLKRGASGYRFLLDLDKAVDQRLLAGHIGQLLAQQLGLALELGGFHTRFIELVDDACEVRQPLVFYANGVFNALVCHGRLTRLCGWLKQRPVL